MDKAKDSEHKIQWHQAFVGAMHCELEEDIDKLTFMQEYSITRNPLRVDLLIIKKQAGDRFKSRLGRILSKYNILEYKSPGDSLGIDALFQALTYACYYKSSAEHENERKDTDITVMLIRNEYPETLTGYLEGKKCTVTEQERGIYRVSGNTFFNLLIIASGEMSPEDYTWLNALRDNLAQDEYTRLVQKSTKVGDEKSREAVLEVVDRANQDSTHWKEEGKMASYLMEAKQEGIQEGILKGRQEGIQEGRQELLRELRKAGYNIPESFDTGNTPDCNSPSKVIL